MPENSSHNINLLKSSSIYPVGETGLPKHLWKIKKHSCSCAFCSILQNHYIVVQVKNLIVCTPSCFQTSQCTRWQVSDYYPNNRFSCSHYYNNKTEKLVKYCSLLVRELSILMPKQCATPIYSVSERLNRCISNLFELNLFRDETSERKKNQLLWVFFGFAEVFR